MTGSVRVKGINDDSFGCEASHSSGAYLGNAAQASVELAQEQASPECTDDALTERAWRITRPPCPDWRR